MADTKGGKRGGDRDGYQLELVGLKPGSERPLAVVQVLDKKRTVIHFKDVGKDGSFAIPADVLKSADRVVVGAADGEGGVVSETAATFRAGDFALAVSSGTLALAEGIWARWPYSWTCATGSVRVCRRRPWWYDSLFYRATELTPRVAAAAFGRASRNANPAMSLQSATFSPALAFDPSLSELIAWPYRCDVVCYGTVEVYRRTCCCHPLIIDDFRIDDLIRQLAFEVVRLPKVPPRGPRFPPPPPPIDPLRTPFFKGGALNEFAINAATDLSILRSLPRDQAAVYINSRAYLFHRLCSCGSPVKVGTGNILPNGTFNVCWRDIARLHHHHCYDQYAYVVKQTIGVTTTTIYNGLTAGAWYGEGVSPVLTSYNAHAYTCGETGPTGGSAFVFLDLIGDTESHELTTPDATNWGSVAAPVATSGLLFPNPTPSKGHLRNLGGALELTFTISEGMKAPAVGAMYYRISVSQADASGNPTGTRHFHGTGLSWQKVVGSNIVPETLGPFSVGTEDNLFKIPYNSDATWTGEGRYHALIDTTSADFNLPIGTDLASAALNHLITLEVFNAAGERLRPLGTPSASGVGGLPGADVARPFEYRRWFQPGGSVGDDTQNVPFAALTHLFCWDNRVPVADITRLVRNGVASGQECQFLVGTELSTFGIEYRAYVPDERFQESHSIGWLRGLNGTTLNGGVGTLPTPLSPSNVGKPLALPANSGTNTFQEMLTRIDPITGDITVLDKCSFAVTLTTLSKLTNGESFHYPFDQETAAFALEIE